ncbi:hypothetical protein M9435_001934 [Picochlorum sp. BPE23]|nr:hypothetical protein M9435_001934 [Picochlorum sp. BPE23]
MAKSGDKKRIQANQTFLKHFRLGIGVSNVIFIIIRLLLKRQTVSTWHVVGYVLALGAMFVSHSGLTSALTPAYSATGDVIFAGADLSMGGMLEYYQDVAYLCMFALTVGAFTDWAWLVFLSIPLFCIHLIWKYVIGPWLNAPSQSEAMQELQEDDATKKRREKKERQAARREKFSTRRM